MLPINSSGEFVYAVSNSILISDVYFPQLLIFYTSVRFVLLLVYILLAFAICCYIWHGYFVEHEISLRGPKAGDTNHDSH
jgi:hypothetical protein